MISESVQTRILNYFTRLQDLSPSQFSNNYVKEWHYLVSLRDMVLKDIEQDINDAEKIKQSGLLDK